ncbi:MAG: cytochrome c oxidase subunit I [Acidimicrobiales bacterium]
MTLQVGKAQSAAGELDVGRPEHPLSRSIVSGIAVGLPLALIVYFLTAALTSGQQGRNDALVLAYLAWGLGFLIGVGAFGRPLQWAVARTEPTPEDELRLAGARGGVWRFFRYTTDHKVVGVQYLVMGMVLFAAGGLAAMLIRLEVMRPGAKMFPIQTYNTIIGMHGLIMVVATIIMITGSFGNFVVPIMIGARDMAFPRLNALSFWLLFVAVPIFLTAPLFGGFQTGWTAYAPLANQTALGMDAYSVTILFFVASTAVAAVNVVTTVSTMRAPGMSWTRLPILTWGVVASSALGLFVMPAFLASQVLLMLDRTVGTSFYVAARGGSDWLYEHLFWFMGHPEVYVIALPAFAVVLEVLPVFTRKPLFGYRMAVGGILGVTLLSTLVWAHHMFVTGWSPTASGPFMLTTELISIPTGLVFLASVGTLWRGKAWMTVPMLYVISFLWNFVIGGVTGLYLADVPTDVQLHGSLFVTAHFHYTLMGGAMMGFLAGVYYWYPKMFGRMYDDRLARIQFWLMQIGFNVTFMAMFYVGLQGEPRRVGDYAAKFAVGNLVSSIGAFVIGASMLLLWYNLVASKRRGAIAPANPWGAKTLEWQVPTPVPFENFEEIPRVVAGPYEYGEPSPEPQPERVPAAGEEALS